MIIENIGQVHLKELKPGDAILFGGTLAMICDSGANGSQGAVNLSTGHLFRITSNEKVFRAKVKVTDANE